MTNFSQLELHSKTNEIVVTFSRRLTMALFNPIHGSSVEIKKEFKYMETVFDANLGFSSNAEVILGKCHQGLYLLRKMLSLSVIKFR